MRRERWNGRKWAIQPAPLPAGDRFRLAAGGVSCGTRLACTLAGYTFNDPLGLQARVEHWNGARWVIQATPAPDASLSGVSCGPRGACVAVGGNQFNGTIVERRP